MSNSQQNKTQFGFIVIGIFLVFGVFLWSSCSHTVTPPVTSSATAPLAQTSVKMNPVERGKYLVSVIGCGDCHTPHDDKGNPISGKELTGHWDSAPLPDWDPALLKKKISMVMGPDMTSFAGPFGVSAAINLTPDPDSGIGKMTADDLIKSWRTGKHWQVDREILPPMPANDYKNLSDDDIKAIYAYLMTLKPVNSWATDSGQTKDKK